MTLLKTILVCCFLFMAKLAFSSTDNPPVTDESPIPGKIAKKRAKDAILTLSDGVLLVRLRTRKATIDTLRKFGHHKKAEKLEKIQAEVNKNLISAFEAHFNFCPTYFFFSDQSVKVKKKEFDQVVFLDKNLQPDSTVVVNNDKFLVAEIDVTRQDTTKYFEGYDYSSHPSPSKKQALYWGGPNIAIDAIVLMSDEFVQIKRPFPYYASTKGTQQPCKQVIEKAVYKLNRKLHAYYNKCNRSNA